MLRVSCNIITEEPIVESVSNMHTTEAIPYFYNVTTDTHPDLWTMPQQNLHMTALEITHSKTSAEIASLVETLRPSLPTICDYTFSHRTRLIKPTIGFDASALALSFVPAANSPSSDTYHHLRRDLYALCREAGVQVDSRYVVPSSHLTIARFIEAKDFEDAQGKVDAGKVESLIKKIEEVNTWLEKEFWPENDKGEIKAGGEWMVGEEKGLDCRMGRLWYGGGDTVHLGGGF